MKKLLVFLWALFTVSASVSAQGQTATLQQGDKMTPFYGEDAFIQAYNAAQKGAVITLSAGEFNTVDSIMKEVTIIGNGYRENKTVLKEKNFESYSKPISLIIKADNVTLEGLDMICVYIRKSNHLTIRHCYIYNLTGVTFNYNYNPKASCQHQNTIVDQCVIGADEASSGDNYCIKNSIIGAFFYHNTGDATNTLIMNCLFGYRDRKEGSSFLSHAVYKNCLIGACFDNDDNDISGLNGSEFYGNVFFGGLNWYNSIEDGLRHAIPKLNNDTRWQTPTMNLAESQSFKGNTTASYDAIFGHSDEENPLLAPIITTITGDDGKVVGPYGGTGFSWNPGIPRIVDSKIDSYTDEEGKLNAKIKVELNN